MSDLSGTLVGFNGRVEITRSLGSNGIIEKAILGISEERARVRAEGVKENAEGEGPHHLSFLSKPWLVW